MCPSIKHTQLLQCNITTHGMQTRRNLTVDTPAHQHTNSRATNKAQHTPVCDLAAASYTINQWT